MKFQKEYEKYLAHNGFIAEDELAHYGVPGMKWGVRKLNKTLDSYSKAYKKRSKTKSIVKLALLDNKVNNIESKYLRQYSRLNKKLKGTGFAIGIDFDYLKKNGDIRYVLRKVDADNQGAYETSTLNKYADGSIK